MDNRLLVVGNWKMELNVQQSSLLINRLQENIENRRSVEVVIAPSMLALQPISLEIDRRKFRLSAQNAFYKDSGPYTGEVSMSMLRDMVQYVIVGHSIRRLQFGDILDVVRDKTQAAVRNGITPIICVGETKQERDLGETKQVLFDQITTSLMNLTSLEIKNVVIAYEPVWAISTFEGVLAKPHQVADAITYIRLQISELYGKKTAKEVRVLYGGSVDASTVRSYLELPEVDGVLVGSASVNYKVFSDIVRAAQSYATSKKGNK